MYVFFLLTVLIFNSQLSRVQAFVNLSIIAILSHALEGNNRSSQHNIPSLRNCYSLYVLHLRWQVCGTDQF